MKRIFWRPIKASRAALVLIAVLALVGITAVEWLRVTTRQPDYDEKLAAASLAEEAMTAIREERLMLGRLIDPHADPTCSGLVGVVMTPMTSEPASWRAKRTSVNPNFAAVVINLLKQAKIKDGDCVAVGVSGSFPALNACVYAALETLRVKPIIIASVASSQWGANLPDFTWLDMERALYNRHLVSFHSEAASLGGINDRGLGMSQEGRAVLLAAIERNKLPLIRAKTYVGGIDERMNLFTDKARGAPIKAYINVGGGTVSVGKSVGKRAFASGISVRAPKGADMIDSVMGRFVKRGVPVIHLVQVEELAERYGLPIMPDVLPAAGEGTVFARQEYNRPLAAATLAAICLALHGFLRCDWGVRGSRPSTAEGGWG